MPDSIELLRRYVEGSGEEAFAELVRQNIDFVYAVALRQLSGDAHLAEDVTQRVFADLARKAASISLRATLGGWLYRSTQFAAADTVRAERRRRTREQKAYHMHTIQLDARGEESWSEVRPVLDQAMGALNDRDRDAVMLRYFDGHPFAEVGRRLRLSEDAARMRVERALETLRSFLARRGVKSTTAALSAMLSIQSGLAAPAGLAAIASSTALASATSAGTGLFGLLKFMSTIKLTMNGAGLLGLVGILGVATIGVATYEFRSAFYGARDARAASAALAKELAALRQTLAASDSRNAALQAELPELGLAQVALARSKAGGGPPGKNGSARQREASIEAERAALSTAILKLNYESRVAERFRKLGLSEAQLEEYANLSAAALAAGVNAEDKAAADGISLAEYRANVVSQFLRDYRALVGDQAYAQLQQGAPLDESQPVVGQLAGYLAAAGTPLDNGQATQLLQIFANTPRNDLFAVPDAVVTQAQGFLSPAQLATWQRMRDVQQIFHSPLNVGDGK